MRWALFGLLLLGCKSGTHGTNAKSETMTSKEARIAFLKDYLGSPTALQDVEFEIVVRDNSSGLLSGPNDLDFKVAVRVKPDHVSKWADGCTAARLDVRPAWVDPMLKWRTGWEVRSQPDTFRCGQEERVIHVREGVIFRRVLTQ